MSDTTNALPTTPAELAALLAPNDRIDRSNQPTAQTTPDAPADADDEGMPVYATQAEGEANVPDQTGRKRPLRLYCVTRPDTSTAWTWARSTNHARLTVTAADGYSAAVATRATREPSAEQVAAKVSGLTPEQLLALLTPEQRAALGIGTVSTPPVATQDTPPQEGKGKGRKGKGKEAA